MENHSTAAEWRVLVECVKASFDARRLTDLLLQPLDWSLLVSLAEAHCILTLVGARIQECGESSVPPEIRQKLRDGHRTQALSTLSMTAELFRLLERFARADIATLAIKGPALSVRCYGDPGIRQYSDLDLIVRDRDIRHSTEVMMGLEYEPHVPLKAIDAGKIPGEYVFTRVKEKLRVEFHTEHTFRYHPRPLPVEDLFKRQIRVSFDAHEVPALSAEDELILISIHGAKHFWERLIWIADVAALVSRKPEIDWERVTLAAREIGAERMLHVGLRLAADLLGAPLPEKIAAAVQSNKSAVRLAVQVLRWLPMAGEATPKLFTRAAFRMRMRGGLLSAPAYLLRLSLSPTEEDWVEGAEGKRPWLFDALLRPFRLARKYGRHGKT